jgi:hypothetical protein
VGYLPESYYPYQAKDQNCSLLEADNLLQKQLKKTSGCKYVESGNEKATTEALMEEGPLAVALDAGHLSFRFYKEGIYYEPECSASRQSSQEIVLYYRTFVLFMYGYLIEFSETIFWLTLIDCHMQ